MESLLAGYPTVIQAPVASLFTWLVTAAGAAAVFFTSSVNRRLLDLWLGFAAVVMIYVVDLTRELRFESVKASSVAAVGSATGSG